VNTLITGTVVSGDKRGADLGFPTANVRLPADGPALEYGVYAGYLDGRPAAISVGVRPTFGDDLEPMLEAYVLDWGGDLYGRTVQVRLRALIRHELRFSSEAELIEEMHRDVARVREVLAELDHSA
jgi:riboflavin kinase/FMN adenylyltransferase